MNEKRAVRNTRRRSAVKVAQSLPAVKRGRTWRGVVIADDLVRCLHEGAARSLAMPPADLSVTVLNDLGALRLSLVAAARHAGLTWTCSAVRLGRRGLACEIAVRSALPDSPDREAVVDLGWVDRATDFTWVLASLPDVGQSALAVRLARALHRVLSRRHPALVAEVLAWRRAHHALESAGHVVGVRNAGQIVLVDVIELWCGYHLLRDMVAIWPGVGVLGSVSPGPGPSLSDPLCRVPVDEAARRLGFPDELVARAYAGDVTESEIAAWQTLAALGAESSRGGRR